MNNINGLIDFYKSSFDPIIKHLEDHKKLEEHLTRIVIFILHFVMLIVCFYSWQ